MTYYSFVQRAELAHAAPSVVASAGNWLVAPRWQRHAGDSLVSRRCDALMLYLYYNTHDNSCHMCSGYTPAKLDSQSSRNPHTAGQQRPNLGQRSSTHMRATATQQLPTSPASN